MEGISKLQHTAPGLYTMLSVYAEVRLGKQLWNLNSSELAHIITELYGRDTTAARLVVGLISSER